MQILTVSGTWTVVLKPAEARVLDNGAAVVDARVQGIGSNGSKIFADLAVWGGDTQLAAQLVPGRKLSIFGADMSLDPYVSKKTNRAEASLKLDCGFRQISVGDMVARTETQSEPVSGDVPF